MKTIFVDLDDVLADYSGAFEQALKKDPLQVYPQSQYGFFAHLPPLDGAVEAMQALLDSDQYKPYILTAPSVYNPMCYTEKRVWVENFLGFHFVRRLIISADKSVMKGDMLIDDNTSGCGQECFEGELLNFGSEQYPDWASIRSYLGV